MNKEKLQTALLVASEDEKLKIKILNQAVIESLKAYRNGYAPASLKAWKVAEIELEQFAGSLLARQGADGGGGNKDSAGGETLPNLLAVVDYLNRQGWKISKSTIYKHSKLNRILPNQAGLYPLKVVDKYAGYFLKRRDGVHAEDDQQREKRLAETRKANAQADHWEMKTKVEAGLLVERDLFEQELTARASIFKADLLAFARSETQEIIDIVNGDLALSPDLVDHLVNRFELFLDRYSKDPQLKTNLKQGN